MLVRPSRPPVWCSGRSPALPCPPTGSLVVYLEVGAKAPIWIEKRLDRDSAHIDDRFHYSKDEAKGPHARHRAGALATG